MVERIECDRVWNDETLKALVVAGDWLGIVHYCSGSNHSGYTRMWSLSMTSHFGPTSLHESRTKADGTPDPEKCVDVPSVFSRINEARNAIRHTMGLAEA